MLRKNKITKKILISYAARSDMGAKRKNNEDNLYCCGKIMTEEIRDIPYHIKKKETGSAVFAVCDGMGGHQFGEKASMIAVQTLSKYQEKMLTVSPDLLNQTVQEYIVDTNWRIRNGEGKQLLSTGTTLALVILRNNMIHAYNIGDSRIYVMEKGKLIQKSVDHTLAAQRVQLGICTDEQARGMQGGNILTACIGICDEKGNDFKVEILPKIPLEGRRRLLLCSDGLTDMVMDHRIEQILCTNKTAEKAAALLVSEALNCGGKDNVTVIVVDVIENNRWTGWRKSIW